jgi:hypothetical protein
LCIILAADGRIYSVMRRQCIRCGNPIWRDAPVLHFYSVIPLVYYRAYPPSHSTQLGDFRWSENGCLIFLIFLLCSLGWILERTLRTNPPPPGCL